MVTVDSMLKSMTRFLYAMFDLLIIENFFLKTVHVFRNIIGYDLWKKENIFKLETITPPAVKSRNTLIQNNKNKK